MGAREWCFYGWREGGAHVFLNQNNAADLWYFEEVNPQSMVHITEKLVELAVRSMQYPSRAGEDIVASTLSAGRAASLLIATFMFAIAMVARLAFQYAARATR